MIVGSNVRQWPMNTEKQLNIARFFIFIKNQLHGGIDVSKTDELENAAIKHRHRSFEKEFVTDFFEKERALYNQSSCFSLLEKVSIDIGALALLKDFVLTLCAIVSFYHNPATVPSPKKKQRYYDVYDKEHQYLIPYHRLLLREILATELPGIADKPKEDVHYTSEEFNKEIDKLVYKLQNYTIKGFAVVFPLNPKFNPDNYKKLNLVEIHTDYVVETIQSLKYSEKEPEVMVMKDVDINNIDVLSEKYNRLFNTHMFPLFETPEIYKKWGVYAAALAFAYIYNSYNDEPYNPSRQTIMELTSQIRSKISPIWKVNSAVLENEIDLALKYIAETLSNVPNGTQEKEVFAPRLENVIRSLKLKLSHIDIDPVTPVRIEEPKKEKEDTVFVFTPVKTKRGEEVILIDQEISPKFDINSKKLRLNEVEEIPGKEPVSFDLTILQETESVTEEKTELIEEIAIKDLEPINAIYLTYSDEINNIFLELFIDDKEYEKWGRYAFAIIYYRTVIDANYKPPKIVYNALRNLIIPEWQNNKFALYSNVKNAFDYTLLMIKGNPTLTQKYGPRFVQFFTTLGFLDKPPSLEKATKRVDSESLTEIVKKYNTHPTQGAEFFGYDPKTQSWTNDNDMTYYFKWQIYVYAIMNFELAARRVGSKDFISYNYKVTDDVITQLRDIIDPNWKTDETLLNNNLQNGIRQVTDSEIMYGEDSQLHLIEIMARAKYHSKREYLPQEMTYSPQSDISFGDIVQSQ